MVHIVIIRFESKAIHEVHVFENINHATACAERARNEGWDAIVSQHVVNHSA